MITDYDGSLFSRIKFPPQSSSDREIELTRKANGPTGTETIVIYAKKGNSIEAIKTITITVE